MGKQTAQAKEVYHERLLVVRWSALFRKLKIKTARWWLQITVEMDFFSVFRFSEFGFQQ